MVVSLDSLNQAHREAEPVLHDEVALRQAPISQIETSDVRPAMPVEAHLSMPVQSFTKFDTKKSVAGGRHLTLQHIRGLNGSLSLVAAFC